MTDNTSFFAYKFTEWSRDITSLASPLVLLLVPFLILGDTRGFYVLLIALLVNEIVASLIKIVYPKKRPTGQTYSTLLEKIDAGSFPSIHAARITLVYLTLLSHTESIVIKVVCALVILLVILSRVNLKKHFWADVIGGFILGGILWWLSSLI